MNDSNNFAFFSFNDDFNDPSTPKNGGGFNRDIITKQYLEYIQAEQDLESMVKDGVIDILVDKIGIFYYFPSQVSIDALNGLNVKPKECTFAEMLDRRGLNIDKYNRFKRIVRRFNP